MPAARKKTTAAPTPRIDTFEGKVQVSVDNDTGRVHVHFTTTTGNGDTVELGESLDADVSMRFIETIVSMASRSAMGCF